ncbi:aminotransferase class V-fold PLP-dependent enzyme [Nannocystis sp. SCPEA4]|uniref:aminotransferase class V-fold PLP-dependent enzyme n=1 Tax=Nannocystis sp. SCPEA4 TaxID=2996787 RepID=UPI00226EBE24|nr:aminotransferase class V-fold PLP-dependent enzyme [Nannocystis sp. SCPEA4]MCY1054278.1 aminotransferase class V-fold PLP-dependent enzyme [Nannocystis sp. SCPEA4]
MRLSYHQLVDRVRARVAAVTAAEFAARRRLPGDRSVVLDVREPDEFAGTGAIEGALHVPRGLVEKLSADILPDLDAAIVVVCASGHRAVLVADVLQQLGYTRVQYLEGGLLGWQAAGLPLAPACVAARPAAAACARVPTWADIRAAFPIVGRQVPVMGEGERALLYLDHAASTHAPEPVLDRYARFMAGEYANIHRGTHLLSRKATEHFDECYYVVSDFLGGDLERDCVVFLGNTTQAVDLAAHVMAPLPGKVVVTELEHHSNDLPHRNRGPVLRARITADGRLDMDHLELLLRKNQVKLVAVTGASNVTGWMPDVHAVARLAHEHGALILVDAAQLLAHQHIDVRPAGDPAHLDFVAAAGHKAYAPFGAAFLYGPRGIMDAAPPYLPGGGTASRVGPHSVEYVAAPDRHQGGTPNIGGVLALAEALRFLDGIGMQHVRQHEVALTRRAMAGMRALGVTLYGPEDPDARLGVISFNVEGVSDPLAAAVLSEERGIAVRNGRFCAHIHVDRLLASQGGATPEPGSAPGAVRASFGLYNDEADVDRLLEAVAVLRDRRWVGRYRVRAAGVTAEFAGRCNDRWMEADAPSPPAQVDADPGAALLFAQLNPSGPTRCYLIADRTSGAAMLVDPRRDQVDRYLAELQRHGLRLELVLDTHTHGDHLSGTKRLKDLLGCAIAMHRNASAPCVDRPLDDGDTISLGGLAPRVWHTPGHTPDSLCLLLPDRVLTGDTLWIGGTGGCDVGGDPAALAASLLRLRGLPAHTEVWPLHDFDGRGRSTIGEEAATNPWLQGDLAQLRARLAPSGAEPSAVSQANARCQT